MLVPMQCDMYATNECDATMPMLSPRLNNCNLQTQLMLNLYHACLYPKSGGRDQVNTTLKAAAPSARSHGSQIPSVRALAFELVDVLLLLEPLEPAVGAALPPAPPLAAGAAVFAGAVFAGACVAVSWAACREAETAVTVTSPSRSAAAVGATTMVAERDAID